MDVCEGEICFICHKALLCYASDVFILRIEEDQGAYMNL